MTSILRRFVGSAALVWGCSGPSICPAASPVIANVEVADVTPSSVTVIWEVDQAPVANTVKIFTDASGSNDITAQFEISVAPLVAGDPTVSDEQAQWAAFEALRAASAAKGVARIRIDGLSPSTTYYLRAVSSSGAEVSEVPLNGTVTVSTPERNSFVSGAHQLRVKIQHPDPTGWVVIASTPSAQYALSSVVGDGAAPDEAFINLVQLFSSPAANFEPSGQTNVNLRIRNGSGVSLTPSFELAFVDGFVVGSITSVDAAGTNSVLEMTEPAVFAYTEGEAVVLAWMDQLPPGSTISLYYDVDDAGQDGTLIVNGLDADRDGAADTYSWNTTGIPDGIYRAYAESSDGVASYAPAPVAIDRAKLDSDEDGMSDLWEELFFSGSLLATGTEDKDLDGRPDRREYEDRTSPLIPDLRINGIDGLNFIAWPIEPVPAFTSADLLAIIGDSAESITRVASGTQRAETTTWNGQGASGPVFPIVAGEGYMLSLVGEYDGIFLGNPDGGAVDLGIGVNLVGFRAAPHGYSAFQLMSALGGSGVVASVGRLDKESQRFENAAYYEGTAAGVDFPVVAGEAYLIHLRQPVLDFRP